MASSTASYYKSIDFANIQFEPVAKVNKLYVASLTAPLLVQTPPVLLATSIDTTEAADVPFVYIRPAGQFEQWLRDAEAHILENCIANKASWFPKKMDDDALRHNFKSFFREDGDFKLKVLPDVAVFDAGRQPAGPEEAAAGTSVRCVLELTRICFGRQEFGAMWRLVQAQVAEVPPCLIDDAAEAAEEYAEDGDDTEGGEDDGQAAIGEADEFL